MEFHIPLMRNTWRTCGRGEPDSARTSRDNSSDLWLFFSLYHPNCTMKSLCPSVVYWSLWDHWTQAETLTFQQAATLNTHYGWKCMLKASNWSFCVSALRKPYRGTFRPYKVTSGSTGVSMSQKELVMAMLPHQLCDITHSLAKKYTVATVLKY